MEALWTRLPQWSRNVLLFVLDFEDLDVLMFFRRFKVLKFYLVGVCPSSAMFRPEQMGFRRTLDFNIWLWTPFYCLLKHCKGWHSPRPRSRVRTLVRFIDVCYGSRRQPCCINDFKSGRCIDRLTAFVKKFMNTLCPLQTSALFIITVSLHPLHSHNIG